MHSKCCNAKVHEQNGSMFCSHCIRLISRKDVRKRHKQIYYILICFLALFLITNANAPNNHSQVIQYVYAEAKQLVNPDVELNDSCILQELIKDSCVLPSVAIAQAHIESGFYKSDKTFENKNIFGIKPHKCKYVKGVKNYQAVYSSYKDCIACYCHIQHYYLKAIDGHYAAAGGYVDLIKKVK